MLRSSALRICARHATFLARHGRSDRADVVNGDVASDNVGVVSNTTATINGSGGLIGMFGNTDTLRLGADRVRTQYRNRTRERKTAGHRARISTKAVAHHRKSRLRA
jgi:hypothetical protein